MQTFDHQALAHRSGLRSFCVASLAGLAFVVPFAALEWVTSRGFRNGVPIVLFVVMWLLPLAFFIVLAPLAHRPWPWLRRQDIAGSVAVLWRLASLVVLAAIWMGLISDQWPCFVGTPNCD